MDREGDCELEREASAERVGEEGVEAVVADALSLLRLCLDCEMRRVAVASPVSDLSLVLVARLLDKIERRLLASGD